MIALAFVGVFLLGCALAWGIEWVFSTRRDPDPTHSQLSDWSRQDEPDED